MNWLGAFFNPRRFITFFCGTLVVIICIWFAFWLIIQILSIF